MLLQLIQQNKKDIIKIYQLPFCLYEKKTNSYSNDAIVAV